jgi:hypothetical protein
MNQCVQNNIMCDAEKLKDFKFGLIAVVLTNKNDPNNAMSVVHFCGYPKKPTKHDIEQLENELNTDPEFGLVGRINKDVFVIRASKEITQSILSNSTE